MTESWTTLEDLAAARGRFAAGIPGYEPPKAFGVARVDADGLTFAHVNDVGGIHLLPAVILASVCGHRGGDATYELSAEAFAEVVRRLTPAGACAEIDHPNLWSWEPLLASADEGASFVAIFVADPDAPPRDRYDAAFRERLGPNVSQ